MTKYILTAILALTALSCGDFLEPKSQSEFVPKEANALNEMLLGEAYPKPSGSTSISAYLEIFNDDICCADTEGTLDDNSISFESGYQALFGWQPTMFITMEGLGMMPINIWESTYEFILGANAALDYIDGVTGTAEEKAYVKAQAYALRAFYYFLLVNTYGMPYNYDKTSLGVPLKLTSALENKFLERNTVDEVYQQIFEDLDNAEDLYLTLPREKQYQPDGKTSLPMVQLLKSRVYLYTENWTEAQRYAQKVIDEWNFSLTDLRTLPAASTAQPYYNFIKMDSPDCVWVYGSIADISYYLNLYVTLSDNSTQKFFNASPDLLDAFTPGDLRKKHYIVTEYRNDAIYLPLGKYQIEANHEPGNSNSFGQAFRLAEAYLNAAEAAVMNDEEGLARTLIEELRQKRFNEENYTPIDPTLTGDALLERIRLERRLELCFEGHRWFDLRRYGRPSFSRDWKKQGVVTKRYTLQHNDLSYAMPLAPSILEKNPYLEQNQLAPER